MGTLDRHSSIFSLQAAPSKGICLGAMGPELTHYISGRKNSWLPGLCFSPGYLGWKSGLAYLSKMLLCQHKPLTTDCSMFLPMQPISILCPKCKFLQTTQMKVPFYSSRTLVPWKIRDFLQGIQLLCTSEALMAMFSTWKSWLEERFRQMTLILLYNFGFADAQILAVFGRKAVVQKGDCKFSF